MGYANRLIRLAFPEFTEEGDQEIFVTIRNPKLVPSDTLVVASVVDRPDDKPITTDEALAANAEVISRLIVAWHVFDAGDESDDPAPLPLPATPELCRKLPDEISDRIMAEIRAQGKSKRDRAESISKTS